MNQPIILPSQVQAQLDKLAKQPPHGILIAGPSGAGKGTVAKYLAAELLDIDDERLTLEPMVRQLQSENGIYSIDIIRELQHFLVTKTFDNGKPIRRIVILENAEQLTLEAQNALLKSLEEPPADTVFILTAVQTISLLPTVRSRLQKLTLVAPLKEDLIDFFSLTYKPAVIEKAYSLSGGLPGLLASLLDQQDEHPLAQAVDTAKTWLTASVYERLLLIDELCKQKNVLTQQLTGLGRLSQAGLEQAAKTNRTNQLKRWHRDLVLSFEAQNALLHSAQAKLLLTHLMLEL